MRQEPARPTWSLIWACLSPSDAEPGSLEEVLLVAQCALVRSALHFLGSGFIAGMSFTSGFSAVRPQTIMRLEALAVP